MWKFELRELQNKKKYSSATKFSPKKGQKSAKHLFLVHFQLKGLF